MIKLNREMKAKFREEKYKNDIVHLRIVASLCILLYSLFSILDHSVVGEKLMLFSIIRFGIVNPLFIIYILFSFHKSFKHIYEFCTIFVFTAAGVGLVIMLACVPYFYEYYTGIFLVLAIGYFLTKINYLKVTIGALIIMVSYVVSFVYLNMFEIALTYIFFYLSFILVCMYGSHTFERYRMEKFSQTYTLNDDKVVLEKVLYDNFLEIENANRITIFSLASLSDARDHFTGKHIERVGELCLKLSKNLPDEVYKKSGVTKSKFLNSIELASTLHDIGKISIPESILLKPGKLTFEEFDLMKEHTTHGAEILRKIKENYSKNSFINMGIEICNYHHENWDGSGYPKGLKGVEIPLSARIVAIIDVFDALLSERPYKKPYTMQESLEIIESEIGKKFDPAIARAFLQIVR